MDECFGKESSNWVPPARKEDGAGGTDRNETSKYIAVFALSILTSRQQPFKALSRQGTHKGGQSGNNLGREGKGGTVPEEGWGWGVAPSGGVGVHARVERQGGQRSPGHTQELLGQRNENKKQQEGCAYMQGRIPEANTQYLHQQNNEPIFTPAVGRTMQGEVRMHFNTVCTCVAVVKGTVGAPYNRSGVLHGCAARWCLYELRAPILHPSELKE
eukprot:EG_transcript_21078